MWVFAGPCNPPPISQAKLVRHRQDRAAGIVDLSDGWAWSILATGTARGVPLPVDPETVSWEGILRETFQGLCLDVHPSGFQGGMRSHARETDAPAWKSRAEGALLGHEASPGFKPRLG